MSATGARQYREATISRERAIEIISSARILVACCKQDLPVNSVYKIEFEVCEAAPGRTNRMAYFRFEAQPLRIIRRITFAEYRASFPASIAAGIRQCHYDRYYEVHTD